MLKNLALVLAVTSGCASESDGTFHVTGRLADPSAVTHVVVWDAESGERSAIDLKSDGSPDGEFDLALAPGKAWGVTFADATKTGPAMRVATLRVGELDAIPPQIDGAMDLGTVSFRAGSATSGEAIDDLNAALGLDAETAERLGRRDDLALRYANPDIDNDGTIDALQGHSFPLDLTGTLRLQVDGRDAEIADLVRGSEPSGLRYLGTSIVTAAPNTMSPVTAHIRFEESFFGTALGRNTAMVPAGTMIGDPHIRFGEPGSRRVGVLASPDHDTPSGRYDVAFAEGMLTFTDVHPPRSAVLSAATEHSVPFLRIRPTTPGCEYACDLAALELTWRRMTAFGWIEVPSPSAANVDIVAMFHGRSIVLSSELRSSLAWQDMPVKGSGITWNELAHISADSLCYVAVSYMSELGMKLTSQATNPACY